MAFRIPARFFVSGLLLPLLSAFLIRSVHAQSAQAPEKKHKEDAPSPQELYKRLSPSVFVVESLDAAGSVVGKGSAVAVAPGEVVTNRHVIENGLSFRLRRGNQTWPATISHIDPDHDLCQLEAQGLTAAPVPVRPSATLAVGERVYAIGSPEGLELTLSEGLISGLREDENARLIQTSAAISPGSSGGGLFDSQGRLVGITTFYLKEGQNLNFALPGEWVVALGKRSAPANGRLDAEASAFEALVWVEIGVGAGEAGDLEKAARAFEKATHLKPDFVEAWYNLGRTYFDLQRYGEAINAYQVAIRLKPDLAEAWNNLGGTYAKLDQISDAIKAFQEAIRLKPDFAEAWDSLWSAPRKLVQLKSDSSSLS